MTIKKITSEYMIESLPNGEDEYKYVFFATLQEAREYAEELKRDFLDKDISIYKVEGLVE